MTEVCLPVVDGRNCEKNPPCLMEQFVCVCLCLCVCLFHGKKCEM